MLASVASATLLGVEGRPVRVEVHVSKGLPGVHGRRPARHHVPRGPRPGPGRAAVEPARVAQRPGHGQPGAAGRAQGRRRPRPRHRRGPAGGQRAAARRARVRRAPSSASWASTARCVPVPGALPLIDALADARGRGAGGVHGRGAARRPPRGPPGGPPRGAGGRAHRDGSPGPTRPSPWCRRRRPPGPDLADVRGQPAARYAARGRRRGRAPPAARRPAGRGQDDAGPPAGRAAARPRPAQALEATCIHSAAGLPLPPGRAHPPPAAPCAAPRRLRGLAGRRRARASMQPGELSLGPQRRAVPRRAGRVRAAGARQPAPAAGGGRHPGGPGRGQGDVPGPVPARGGHEPVPVRRGRRHPAAVAARAPPAPATPRRLSGPLLDRFDLRVEVGRPDVAELLDSAAGEPTRRGGRQGGAGASGGGPSAA